MKKLYTLFSIITVSIVISLHGYATAATFNPNYVLSDADLQDYQSMGRGEIEVFLKNKNSFLSTYNAPDVNNEMKSASEIIYQAAQEYKISPKYILVMLQKEMSLITSKNPTDRQLDYAAGYSVCDSCSFSDPQVIKYKGFGKQVDAAAGVMRWYYDNVKHEAWIKRPNTTYAIDGIAVSPANYATGFMYTYTPHIEGNENFWKIWRDWFDQVYPDGSLLKAMGSNDVYVIQNGKKRLITSMSALTSRYDVQDIIEVPSSELVRYDLGAPLSFPNYSILKLKSGSTYYLVDFDTVRPFKNAETFKSYGYNPQEVIEVTASEIADYAVGKTITLGETAPSGQILSFGSSLYYVDAISYAPILDTRIAEKRFPRLSIEDGTGQDLGSLTRNHPMLFPNATLIGDSLTGHVYVIDNAKRRHITDEQVFLGMGYKWDNVIWVDTTVVDIHPLGEPVYLRTSVIDTTPTSPTPDPIPTTDEPASTSNEEEFYAAPNASLPISFPENGKMLRTPAEKTTFYGSNSITTNLDAYAVADVNGKILAGKNLDVVRPMASLTKVVNAYRLFNEGLDLNRSSVYHADKHKADYHAYRIIEGEGVKNDDLLKAMLVTSRNTPARMLVTSVSDEGSFIDRMNAQAFNWGLNRTTFEDSYGYSLNNQTTARDYVRLFKKSIEHPTIKSYLGIDSFSYNETFDLDNKPQHAGIHTNALQRASQSGYEVIASKTGYLYESGYNHAMLIERTSDGTQFIIVTLGYPDFSTRHNGADNIANWAITTF